MGLTGDDPLSLYPAAFRQSPFHVEWTVVMDGDGELRCAKRDTGIGRQGASADRYSAVPDAPTMVERKTCYNRRAEIDQRYWIAFLLAAWADKSVGGTRWIVIGRLR